MAPDPALFEHNMVITIPDRADGPDDLFERIELDVETAIEPLGPTAMLDGTGHGDDVFELFLYANDADALIDAVLTVEFPTRTRAVVEVDDAAQRRRKTFSVALAGDNKGKRSRVKTIKLVEQLGDWFAVPLTEPDALIVGRITHISRYFMIAYFFGPRRSTPPTPTDLEHLTANDALVVCRCYRLDFEPGRAWSMIGAGAQFDQSEWPLPDLEFIFGYNGSHYLEVVDPRTLDRANRTELIPEPEHFTRPPSKTFFHEDLQAFLDHALDHPDERYSLPYPE